MPWRASGALKADLRSASLDNLEVRVGPEDRALAANGSAQIAVWRDAARESSLAAKQLNFDALLRGEGEDSASPAKAYEA